MDTTTRLLEGQTIEGINGLRAYLINDRRDDIVRHFCSDRPLLDTMVSELERNGYRCNVAVESIVLSDQFCRIRPVE